MAIAAVGNGNWEMLHSGDDNPIYRLAPGAGIHGWQPMEGTYVTDIAATMNRDGRIELIHIGGDRAIRHAWQLE